MLLKEMSVTGSALFDDQKGQDEQAMCRGLVFYRPSLDRLDLAQELQEAEGPDIDREVIKEQLGVREGPAFFVTPEGLQAVVDRLAEQTDGAVGDPVEAVLFRVNGSQSMLEQHARQNPELAGDYIRVVNIEKELEQPESGTGVVQLNELGDGSEGESQNGFFEWLRTLFN